MHMSKTVSTCVSETEQGTHVFNILGYSQHRGIGVGKFVISGNFFIGGHKWAVVVYPDGISDKLFPDCTSVALLLLGKRVTKVRASCELRLVDPSTGLSFWTQKTAPRELYPDDRGSLAFFMEKRSVFETPTVLQHDRLIVECIVTVIKQPRRPETKSFPKIEVPASDITKHFGNLLEEKVGVDVTFSVGGENFTAHKNVLATRSPVFKAELYGPMSESGEGA